MTHTRLPSASINGLRLAVFIAVSVAGHWLILASGTQSTPTYPVAASLSVTLLPAAREANNNAASHSKKEAIPEQLEQQPVKPSPIKNSDKSTTIVAEAAVEKIVTKAAQQQTIKQTTATHAEASSRAIPQPSFELAEKAAFSLAQTRQHVRALLDNDLGRHFSYPRIAHKRGWEGTVLLDLLIETDGRISRVSVAQSSGYRLLDNSAIETLHKVGNVRDAARWLQGHSLELQLPIIYRLTAM